MFSVPRLLIECITLSHNERLLPFINFAQLRPLSQHGVQPWLENAQQWSQHLP